MTSRRVLVVEDEQDIAELLALHLGDIGCEVTLAADGHDGMRQAFAREWDLVILDLCLPGPDGLSICRRLRRESRYVPVLMLTSKSSERGRRLRHQALQRIRADGPGEGDFPSHRVA